MAWNEIRHRARLAREYAATPPVLANESRLGQLFLNLIMNAAQAIPEGRAEENVIRLTTGTDPAGAVVVSVADTGVGMAPEVKQRLFTPFFTTKPVGVGTGLGLAICRRIVAELGGEIAVESGAGKGSVFRVTLPASPRETPAESPAASAPVRAARRGRVLVVDDEPSVSTAIRRTLALDHDVSAAASGVEALALLRSGARFDVILCDLMMPQMTGMDLHRELAGLAPEMAAQMIFVTAGAFTPAARRFLDEVPNLRVDKPFEPQHLRALVNERVR
jgi:CheY-like chemotaxis protein